MKKRLCVNCMRNKVSTHDYCNYCVTFLLPHSHVDSFKKEYYFLTILDEFLIKRYGINMVMGETLPNTKYRPDAYFHFNNKLFIVEIDEYCHKHYMKEEERENSIFNIYPHSVIIRMNVDSYKAEGAKYPSIWNKYTYFFEEIGYKYIHVNTHVEELERRKSILIAHLPDILYSTITQFVVRFFYDV